MGGEGNCPSDSDLLSHKKVIVAIVWKHPYDCNAGIKIIGIEPGESIQIEDFNLTIKSDGGLVMNSGDDSDPEFGRICPSGNGPDSINMARLHVRVAYDRDELVVWATKKWFRQTEVSPWDIVELPYKILS